MHHARLVIHRMHLDGVEVPVRFGTLVVVARTERDGESAEDPAVAQRPGDQDTADDATVDWEVVADGVDEYAGGLERHHVELLCITHANDDGQLVLGELSGDAIVVRFVERTVVLRGDGPLSGITPAMFET